MAFVLEDEEFIFSFSLSSLKILRQSSTCVLYFPKSAAIKSRLFFRWNVAS